MEFFDLTILNIFHRIDTSSRGSLTFNFNHKINNLFILICSDFNEELINQENHIKSFHIGKLREHEKRLKREIFLSRKVKIIVLFCCKNMRKAHHTYIPFPIRSTQQHN